MIPSGEPTRVIFGNIAYGWLVYIFAVAMAVAFGWGCYRHYRLWRQGKPAFRLDRPWERVKALFGHGFGHQRLIKDAYPGLMHLFIFSAFVVEFIGTALIALQVDLGRVFLWGDFYLYYSLVLDIFGVLGIIGLIMAAERRYLRKVERLTDTPDDGLALLILFIVFFTGFLVEGMRIGATELAQHPGWAVWSPGGLVIAKLAAAWGLYSGDLSDLAPLLVVVSYGVDLWLSGVYPLFGEAVSYDLGSDQCLPVGPQAQRGARADSQLRRGGKLRGCQAAGLHLEATPRSRCLYGLRPLPGELPSL